MIPTLNLHEKWGKALSPEDRAHILENYLNRMKQDGKEITYFPIKVTRNYRGDMLLTVFIENWTENAWYMNKTITCRKDGQVIASAFFNEPNFTVASFTIMPWTFIYEKEQIEIGAADFPLSTLDLKVSDDDVD